MQIVLQCFTKRETRMHQKEPLALYKGFCFCFVWVCRGVEKAQNFYFLFAETSASLKILFWHLLSREQSSKNFVWHLLNVSKAKKNLLMLLTAFINALYRRIAD